MSIVWTCNHPAEACSSAFSSWNLPLIIFSEPLSYGYSILTVWISHGQSKLNQQPMLVICFDEQLLSFYFPDCGKLAPPVVQVQTMSFKYSKDKVRDIMITPQCQKNLYSQSYPCLENFCKKQITWEKWFQSLKTWHFDLGWFDVVV